MVKRDFGGVGQEQDPLSHLKSDFYKPQHGLALFLLQVTLRLETVTGPF